MTVEYKYPTRAFVVFGVVLIIVRRNFNCLPRVRKILGSVLQDKVRRLSAFKSGRRRKLSPNILSTEI
jgi:hypothetical protein